VGTGLRYGEDPEYPDAEVVALAATRRELMQEVGRLGDLIAKLEETRLGILPVDTLDELSQFWIEFEQKAADDERTVGVTASPDAQGAFDQLLSRAPQLRAALTGWRDMTLRDFGRARTKPLLQQGCTASSGTQRQSLPVTTAMIPVISWKYSQKKYRDHERRGGGHSIGWPPPAKCGEIGRHLTVTVAPAPSRAALAFCAASLLTFPSSAFGVLSTGPWPP